VIQILCYLWPMPRKLLPLILTFICLPMIVTIATDCSWLRGACADVLPTITQGQAFASEAAQALQQAEKFIESMPVADLERAKLVDAVDRGHNALRAAAAALASTADACRKPELTAVFRTFIDAWEIIRSIVGESAKMEPGKFGAGHPRFKVVDPMIYTLSPRPPK